MNYLHYMKREEIEFIICDDEGDLYEVIGPVGTLRQMRIRTFLWSCIGGALGWFIGYSWHFIF